MQYVQCVDNGQSANRVPGSPKEPFPGKRLQRTSLNKDNLDFKLSANLGSDLVLYTNRSDKIALARFLSDKAFKGSP